MTNIKEQEWEKEMKEEFVKEMSPKSTIMDICNWWIDKLNSNRSQLLQEIEERGRKKEFTMKVKSMNRGSRETATNVIATSDLQDIITSLK